MIAVCGECLIDFIPKASSQTVSKPSLFPEVLKSKKVVFPFYHPCIGGSPLNTAVALSRLGAPVTMISRLSKDAFGSAIKKHLTINGVRTSTLGYGEEPTTIGFVIPKKDGGEDFVFYAEKSADRFISKEDLPTPLSSRIRHIHFSSISLQMDPCGHTYEQLMKREFRHRTISLDPNVRSFFIQSRQKYRDRIERMMAMVGIFRASDQDLKYLYPKSSPEAVIRKNLLRLQPPQIAVLTCGQKGVVAFYRDPQSKGQIQKLNLPAFTIFRRQVVDTVGAGDSFTGAFLHILYQHKLIGNFPTSKKYSSTNLKEILPEALNFAVRAAAINCSREGCDPAFINEINKLEKQC